MAFLELKNVGKGFGAKRDRSEILAGINRLDYSPLRSLAAAGLPPIVVLHGGLLDLRLTQLDRRSPGDLLALARLALRRDLVRLPALKGLRWLGAGDYVAALREHECDGRAR